MSTDTHSSRWAARTCASVLGLLLAFGPGLARANPGASPGIPEGTQRPAEPPAIPTGNDAPGGPGGTKLADHPAGTPGGSASAQSPPEGVPGGVPPGGVPGGVVADPPAGDPRAPTVTLVTEKGDDQFVLNRIESDTTHFVPNGYVRMIHYRKLCATPCNVPVPATGRYFLTSGTARPSRAFELPGYRAHYELSVKPTPRWVGWLGFALAVVGPTAGVLLATMPIWVDMPKANARAAQIGGITLGLALGGTGVGLAYTRSRVTVR